MLNYKGGGEGVGAPLLNTEIDPKLVRSNLVLRSYRLIVTKMDVEGLGMRLGSWQWRNFSCTFFPFSVQLCLFLFTNKVMHEILSMQQSPKEFCRML